MPDSLSPAFQALSSCHRHLACRFVGGVARYASDKGDCLSAQRQNETALDSNGRLGLNRSERGYKPFFPCYQPKQSGLSTGFQLRFQPKETSSTDGINSRMNRPADSYQPPYTGYQQLLTELSTNSGKAKEEAEGHKRLTTPEQQPDQ